MDAYVPIGELRKPHGWKGEIRLWIGEEYEESLLQAEVLFLGEGPAPVPYFVEWISESPGWRVKLEEVDSREDAVLLNGKKVCLRATDIILSNDRQIRPGSHASPYQQWVGFEVSDRKYGPLGKILEIREYPFQWMAIVSFQGTELLIPLHKELILRSDEEKKVLLMDLPEGLLEL